MWVARCKVIDGTLIDKDLSPRFKDIYDCQKYIDENLKILEYLLSEVQSFIDLRIDKNIKFRFGNYIRCYNVTQKRFCTGMDY